MPEWMLPTIIDYWDTRVEAIDRLSRVLEGTPPAARPQQIQLIKEAVKKHVAALSDSKLATAAYVISDDLYKSVTQLGYWDEPLAQYLAATGEAFFASLAQRGFVVNYYINNTWSSLVGPVKYFHKFFHASSLLYFCPQQIASLFFEDRPEQDWPALIAKYLKQAREGADNYVNECLATNRHFVYLDIDPDIETQDLPTAVRKKLKDDGEETAGLVFMYRSEAAVPGSRVAVRLPPGPAQRTAADSAAPAPTRPSAPGTPQTTVTIQDSSGGSPRPASIADLEFLLNDLTVADAERRRFAREVLGDQIRQFLAGMTPQTDLVSVKTLLTRFQDAGYQLMRSNVSEGMFTVVEAIEAVLKAVRQNPAAKALLPTVADERVRSMTECPAADAPNPMPAYAALVKAAREANAQSRS